MPKTEKKLLLELHYLPCIRYFTLLAKCNVCYIETSEHYDRQSYRNRCYILAANKTDRLTVPVCKGAKGQPITEVLIDYRENWQNRHWRAIFSAYGKSPYFEYFGELFEVIIFKGYARLFDLNQDLLTLCLKLLGLSIEIRHTDTFQWTLSADYLDARYKILPQTNIGIIHAQPYTQMFGNTFVENLSIIDLLFNEGPNARNILVQQNDELLELR